MMIAYLFVPHRDDDISSYVPANQEKKRKNKLNTKTKILIHVVTPLIGGLAIYFMFRSKAIWINKKLVKIFGENSDWSNLEIPNWVVYNLPDGLWSYSLMSAILLLFEIKIDRESIPWIVIALLFPISFEVGQKFNITNGTFDLLDVLYSLGFSLFSIFFLTSKFFNNEEQTKS